MVKENMWHVIEPTNFEDMYQVHVRSLYGHFNDDNIFLNSYLWDFNFHLGD